MRYQINATWPPLRRAARSLASIVGHLESSNPLSPACGSMSYAVLYWGSASGIGLVLMIFASIVFHCAPNAADPCAAIKSTTNAGGSEGGIIGAGAAGAGVCATAAGSIAHKVSMAR